MKLLTPVNSEYGISNKPNGVRDKEKAKWFKEKESEISIPPGSIFNMRLFFLSHSVCSEVHASRILAACSHSREKSLFEEFVCGISMFDQLEFSLSS